MACGKGWSVFPFPSAFLHLGVSSTPQERQRLREVYLCLHLHSRRARIQRNTVAFSWKVLPGRLWEAEGWLLTHTSLCPGGEGGPQSSPDYVTKSGGKSRPHLPGGRGAEEEHLVLLFTAVPYKLTVAHEAYRNVLPKTCLSSSPSPPLPPPLRLQLTLLQPWAFALAGSPLRSLSGSHPQSFRSDQMSLS